MTRNYINEEYDNWEEILDLFCFAYRGSVHASTYCGDVTRVGWRFAEMRQAS